MTRIVQHYPGVWKKLSLQKAPIPGVKVLIYPWFHVCLSWFTWYVKVIDSREGLKNILIHVNSNFNTRILNNCLKRPVLWMGKELVVHLYKEILLSHKKEQIWVSCSEVDEPRASYTEWSKSENEKQVLYINTYIWNLDKCYW